MVLYQVQRYTIFVSVATLSLREGQDGEALLLGNVQVRLEVPKARGQLHPLPKAPSVPREGQEMGHPVREGAGVAQDFTVDRITKDTYICSLHFPEGSDLNHR